MKSPVIIFRRSLRELTTARKMTLTITVLCLLAGSVFFFQTAPMTPSDPTVVAQQTNPADIAPDSREAAGPTVPDTTALPPALPAMDQPPPPTSPASAEPPPAIEISLPAPPSGDYELDLTAEQINAIVEKRYGALFQSLALPPEQLTRLRALLIERQQVTVDAANAALLNGVNPVRELPTIRSAIEQAQASIDAILRNELGEPLLNACRDFDRTLGERNLASDFSRLLTTTGEPITPELERQVVEILNTFPGQDSPGDIDHMIFGGINTRARISEQAIAQAAAVLSPRQLKQLRLLQQQRAGEDAHR